MRTKFLLHIGIFCIVLGSCDSKQKNLRSKVRDFVGSEIIIPKSLLLFNNENGMVDRDAICKFIFYVDSLNCSECLISHAGYSLQFFASLFDHNNFSLNIIFETQDIQSIENIFNRFDLKLPYFIDFNGDFERQNKIPQEELFHTFMTVNDTVVLVGDMVRNRKMQDLYVEQIKELIKKDFN